MSPQVHCITLPVDDLARSLTFYRDGLGLPVEGGGPGDDHLVCSLEGGRYLVLITRDGFAGFTELVGVGLAERGHSGCILSHFTGARVEVDTLLARVRRVGGGRVVDAAERPWGYAGYVADPDGHVWEIMYNANLAGGGAEQA